jgi:hypothetical protein
MKVLTALIVTLACLVSNVVYASDETTVSFFIRTPSDLVSVSHGGQVGFALFPAEIPSMAGTPISNTLLLTARVRDDKGEISGISSELETFPDGPVTAEKIWDTYCTVVIPGRGTLYGYHQEQLNTEIFKVMDTVHQTGQDWTGEITTRNTVGPLPEKRGLIVSGTGEFENATGWFVEIGTLRGYTREGDLSAELELRFTITE